MIGQKLERQKFLYISEKSMKIKIKKIYPDAIIPQYQREGDAGLDLYSYEDYELKSGQGKSFKTGVAIEVPKGFVMLIWDRSGLAFNHGLTCLAGVIDSNFRGEICVYLLNTSKENYKIEKGHRIAQFLIQPVERVEFEETDELSDSERGEDWSGSSGY